MNAHTPGPWSVEPLQWDHGASIAIVSSGPDAYIVATIAPENEEDEPDMHTAKRGPCDEANARLMAAAPELLCVARLALDFVERESEQRDSSGETVPGSEYVNEPKALIAELSAAIAKAEAK